MSTVAVMDLTLDHRLDDMTVFDIEGQAMSFFALEFHSLHMMMKGLVDPFTFVDDNMLLRSVRDLVLEVLAEAFESGLVVLGRRMRLIDMGDGVSLLMYHLWTNILVLDGLDMMLNVVDMLHKQRRLSLVAESGKNITYAVVLTLALHLLSVHVANIIVHDI